MKTAMTTEERRVQMLETPVEKLITTLAIPTTISMLITSIYNMADTYFVSQLGTSASGAVGIIFSLMALIQAISFMLGMGSGNQVAMALGNKEESRAKTLVATAFFTAVGIGVLFLVLGNIMGEKLVYLLGSTETIAPYALDYMRYILLAAPFMMGSLVMNNLLRAQGNAMHAMFGIGFGGILNMILDPIFIFVCGMGISGAGLATMTSQILSFFILFYQCNSRKDNVSILWNEFKPTKKLYGTIFYVGSPSLCRQGLQSVAMIVLNYVAAPFGDAAIAALSIVSKIATFIYSALIGFGQGFQPVCGYNYGAKRYDRVLQGFWFCVKVGTILLTVLAILGFIVSQPLITAFRADDAEVIRIGVKALRYQLVLFPFLAWFVMNNMLSQSIGYGVRASLVAMSRQGIFFIPCALIFPSLLGEAGLYIIQPVADVFSLVMATAVGVSIIRELKGKMKED
ncbi:MAG: MATE family efflux transporter [Eubacteriales bacterium]